MSKLSLRSPLTTLVKPYKRAGLDTVHGSEARRGVLLCLAEERVEPMAIATDYYSGLRCSHSSNYRLILCEVYFWNHGS